MEGTAFAPALEGMKHVKSDEGEMLTKPFLEAISAFLFLHAILVQYILVKTHGEMPMVCKSCKSCRKNSVTPSVVISRIGPNIRLIDLVFLRMQLRRYLRVKYELPPRDKFGAAMALVKSDVGGNITRLETKYLSSPSEFNNLYSMVRVEIEAKTAKASSSCTNGLLWLTRAMDFILELFRNLLEHADWTMTQACTDAYNKTLKKWHGWLASSSFTLAMKLAPDRKKFMDVVGGNGDINSDIEKFCTSFTPLLQENHKFLASVGLDDLKAS